MSLRQQIDADLKDAMRSRDRLRLNVLRQIKSTVINEEFKTEGEFDDAKVQEIVGRLARQHRESIEIYGKADRPELKKTEEDELQILQSYLPEQVSAEEILVLAKQAAEAVGAQGPSDKGKVMGRLMPQFKGKADGTLVNQVVTDHLASLAE